MSIRLSRRRVIPLLASSGIGIAGLLSPGCGQSGPKKLPPAGRIVGASASRGHLVRGAQPADLTSSETKSVDVVVVGGGISGLSACRELDRQGIRDYVLLELEDNPGGTSRGGASTISAYPWGAHYLPAPMANNKPLLELLSEMGIVQEYDQQGHPVFVEEFLCRDPEERLFFGGRWQTGPAFEEQDIDESSTDLAEWNRFQTEIGKWVLWRDAAGRRAFTLPVAEGSDAEEVGQLDHQTMSDWLKLHKFTSPLVLWEVDYACRDDYGTTPDQTSAWAGIFYFASRLDQPGDEPRPFLTWPEGNARFVHYLAGLVADRLKTGRTVTSIGSETGDSGSSAGAASDHKSLRAVPRTLRVQAHHSETGQSELWQAHRVIFAGPQFVARHVVSGYSEARAAEISEFSYAPWIVANLHLRQRPAELGFPAAWDNIIRDSPGLGYVMATHQTGADTGPTVFTYYRPLCEFEPHDGRRWLEKLEWAAGADMVLTDLEQAHPDLRMLVERLDIMYWGHGMIRPVPGFRTGNSRKVCLEPFQGVHFAHTELSGVALLEEAFYHGVRAAGEVAAVLKGVPR